MPQFGIMDIRQSMEVSNS